MVTGKRPQGKVRVLYKDWATNPDWISYRRSGNGHVPARIHDCMKMGLIGTRGKKKRRHVQRKQQDEGKEAGTALDESSDDDGEDERKETGKRKQRKKYVDVRKWCMYCTRVVTVNCANGPLRFDKECRFVGVQFRKTTKNVHFVLSTTLPWEKGFFLKWHTKDLPADDINEDADGNDAEDEDTGDGNDE
jgi:hypothetical protein